MSIGTFLFERTMALEVEFAYWLVGRDAMTVVLEEVGGEGEFVGLWWREVQDLGREGFGV